MRLKKIIVSICSMLLIIVAMVCFVSAEGSSEGIVTASALNIREMPDVASGIVGSVKQNQKVSILSKENGWYKIECDNQEGWVFGQYISSIGETPSLGTVKAYDVNVRKGAGTSFGIVERVDYAQKIRILDMRDLGEQGIWYKVSYDDVEGWVRSDLVSIIGEVITAGYVNATDVNVRDNPNTQSEIITKLNENDKVGIYGKYKDWYIVELPNKDFGWIFSRYVEIRNPGISRGENDQPMIREVSLEGIVTLRQQIVEYAKKFMGVKYVWGGESPKGLDCSGFVQYVFKHFGINLPHNAAMQSQSKLGTPIKRAELEPGDAVFFVKGNYINHVGLYIGNGQFIHASSAAGKVTISSLSGYYLRNYGTARKFVD